MMDNHNAATSSVSSVPSAPSAPSSPSSSSPAVTTTTTVVVDPSTSPTDAASTSASHPEQPATATAEELPTNDKLPYTPVRETTPTPKDIETLSQVTSHLYSSSLTKETADHIKALTNALTASMAPLTPDEPASTSPAQTAQDTAHTADTTTPITTETHDAVAATITALTASVHAAAATSSASSPAHMDEDPQADNTHLINQVLSIVNSSTRPTSSKRKADQEMYDQNQAAQALQSIAQSLSNLGTLDPSETETPTTVAATTTAETAGGSDFVKQEASDAASTHMEGVVQTSNTNPISDSPATTAVTQNNTASVASATQAATITGQSVAESLLAAFNFPTESTAFAQAILSAANSEATKNKASSVVDQSTLQALSFPSTSTTTDNNTKSEDSGASASSAAAAAVATASSSTSLASSTSRGGQTFTFEMDKSTGKTMMKWAEESPAEQSLNAANAALQALHTLLVNSGLDASAIPGFAELTGATASNLMAPPIGAFPAQGSQFGTAQDPPGPDPSNVQHQPQPVRKKKRVNTAGAGGPKGQNTAASIPEGATSYPCTQEGCDKVFARLYNLKSHQRTHTNERNFVCATCQQAFARNHDLKRHVKIHGGDKPFKCNGCGKSFSRLDALGRHRGNSKNRAGCSSVEPTTES
ncbi:hypothetical protein BG004_003634 [Podila humilis]|nr:hypothetical protein BG004_003634 [Podila humilis]